MARLSIAKRQPKEVATDPAQLELFELVERIKSEHNDAVSALGTVAGHAMAIGEMLLQAQIKVQTEGMPWAQWVDENLPFGHGQAAKYLRVAKEQHRRVKSASDAESTVAPLDNLSLRAATKALLPPKPKVEHKQSVQEEFVLETAIERILAHLDKITQDWDQDQLDELADRLQAFVDGIRGEEEEQA